MGDVTDHDPSTPPAESAIDRVRLDPRLRSRDDSGIAAIALGTLAWGIAWVVLTVASPEGADTAGMVCLAGFALGLIGCVLVGYRRWSRAQTKQALQE